MPGPAQLQFGRRYRTYSRGNNRENVFAGERNYRYRLRLYAQHVHLVTETYACCLLSNQIHFLVRIRDFEHLTSWRLRVARKAVRSSQPETST